MKRVEEGAKAKPKAKSPPKVGAKAKPGASEAKPIKLRKGEKVAVLLSGGNPRIAKADGDAPVQAYIAGMPGWKRDLGKRLDALIVRNVPNVRKAVKWNTRRCTASRAVASVPGGSSAGPRPSLGDYVT